MVDARKARPEVNALVDELLERLAQSDVRELEVRRGGIRVKVSRAPLHGPPATVWPARADGAPPEGDAHRIAPAAPVQSGGGAELTAPLTGIFYRSPSPQAPPFVQVGSVVAEGDVVALIEAMKLFNEIRATRGGIVRRVLVENGQLVKARQPIFELDPG